MGPGYPPVGCGFAAERGGAYTFAPDAAKILERFRGLSNPRISRRNGIADMNLGEAGRVALSAPLRMRRGGSLTDVVLAYESWGQRAADGDNVIVLFTGLSPSAHAAASTADPTPGWWEYMVGEGRPLDTRRYQVICFNSLGSCFGSTGPASPRPDGGGPYAVDFPDLCVEDIAAAVRMGLEALGIPRVRALVGTSLGGMSALAFAALYPGFARELVVISAAAAALPSAIAIRSLQREVIRSDPAWQGGRYAPGPGPRDGMRIARKIGLMSYRSALEWEQRFGRERREPDAGEVPAFGIEFQVESYLDANARKFVDGFDANCYLYLSRAMDWFDLAEHGDGDLVGAIAAMALRRALVVGVETDFLFPPRQQVELATALRQAGVDTRLELLPSVQGHDAFLVDRPRFGALLRDFLAAGAGADAKGQRLATA